MLTPQIQIPQLDLSRLMARFSDTDDISEISRISDIQPRNLLNEFNQVSGHLGAPSPVGPDPSQVFCNIRIDHNSLLTGIDTSLCYSESSRYILKSVVRTIMNVPLGISQFVKPTQDDYEPHFQELTERIQAGVSPSEVASLLSLKKSFYTAFQGVLNWIDVDDIALSPEANSLGYVTEYASIIIS